MTSLTDNQDRLVFEAAPLSDAEIEHLLGLLFHDTPNDDGGDTE